MTTQLQRLRKRQRFNRHVEQLTDKKKVEAHRAREKRERAQKKKRRSGLKRLCNGEAAEQAKEAKVFKDAAPHPFRCEEQKARAALAKAATRIDQYGRPEQPAF